MVRLWRPTLLLALFCVAAAAQAASLCASPGQDGSMHVKGVINDYWAAPKGAQLEVGQTRLPLGAHVGKAALDVGDLLLVIQMQGATINSSNDARYGSGQGQGRGWRELEAGQFELVRVQRTAADAVIISGAGPGAGLKFAYLYRDPRAKTDQGRARWQLVRVPQYHDLTLAGDLHAAPWNGATGGVLALDVRAQLQLAGHRLDAAASGFRGAAALPLAGALGAPSDYRYMAPSAQNLANHYGQHGSKGEGLAGTPRWLFVANQRLETLPDKGRNSSDGYANGSMAKGAPANAGGGGEALSLDNRRVSGGGGGGGGEAGGQGSAANGKLLGGLGGAGVGVGSALPMLVMGGGGGASALGGAPLWQGAGGTGGGIVMVLAGKLSGAGQLSVAGAAGRNGPAGGGGGGGGSVLIWSPSLLTQQVKLQLTGGAGGRGSQGAGGAGGAGRLLVSASVDQPAGRLRRSHWPGVLPGFVCQPEGLVLTAQVFDAGKTGVQPGLAGWQYQLTQGRKKLAHGSTDHKGRFSLLLPPSVLKQTLLLHVTLPPGWASLAASEDAATGLSYLGDGSWQLQPHTGGYYQELQLGLVRGPQLVVPEARSVSVNSTQIFPFRYVARANAKVSFQAQASFDGKPDDNALLFLDPRCDGHSQFAAHGKSRVFDVTAGQSFCVRLRVEVGADKHAGDTLAWQLQVVTQVPGLPAPLTQTKRQRYPLVAASVR